MRRKLSKYVNYKISINIKIYINHLHQRQHIIDILVILYTHGRFSDHCTNTVIETSDSLDKTEVQVMWTAPPPGAGCVVFRAAVLEAE